MSDCPPADIRSDNWIREGRKKVSERAREDEEYAEELRGENPQIYYSFEWTPEPPEDIY